LHEFVASLPDGYETRLDERGSNLSTGQRQLLSLARTLAGQPRILILDEATAHVDTHTEAAVQHALTALRGKLTLIVIAHRLSTIRAADAIFVLRHGEVVQRGTHDALVATDGVYRRLCELQELERSAGEFGVREEWADGAVPERAEELRVGQRGHPEKTPAPV
jgi:ABC-type multidrug transport system fused ATPase/permease subunit